MSDLAEFHTRISALFAEAAAQGLKPTEILPDELAGHVTEKLTIANNYIKDLEACDTAKNQRIKELEKELKVAQVAVKNIPADYNATLVELGQARHETEFYKNLYKQGEQYVEKLQNRLRVAEEKLKVIQAEKDRSEHLEDEKLDLEIQLETLMNNRDKLMDEYHNSKEQDHQLLAEMQRKIKEHDSALHQKEEEYAKLKEVLEATEKSHLASKLLMERELVSSAKTTNQQALHIEKDNGIRMATVSEIRPLGRVFEHCAIVVELIQKFAEQLFNAQRRDLQFSPDDITRILQSILKDLDIYRGLRETFDTETLECDEVRENFTALYRSAGHMYHALKSLSADITKYTRQLEQRPDLLTMLRYKFSKLPKLPMTMVGRR